MSHNFFYFFLTALTAPAVLLLKSYLPRSLPSPPLAQRRHPSKFVHIFGKGAGARGGDGGGRGQQSLNGYPDARSASRAQRTRGVFTCCVRRALDARQALQCDLATVLLTNPRHYTTHKNRF